MTATGVSGLQARPDDSSQWLQADVFRLDQVPGLGADGQSRVVPAPLGVAIISQSCDVVLPHRPKVQVAPIVELTGQNARAALDGKWSQYAHLPARPGTHFADLDDVCTVPKAALAGRRVGPGVVGELAARRFSLAVGRRFSRFAFPDDVSDAMKALRDLTQSKASKPESPFGRLMQDVLQLRAESLSWTARPPKVTLILVAAPGILPNPHDDPGPLPERIARLKPDEVTARIRLTEIADALTGQAKTLWTENERSWLWELAADAAALMCQAQANINAAGQGRPPAFTGEVISSDDYSLTRMLRSELLDLDHLSVPYPLSSE